MLSTLIGTQPPVLPGRLLVKLANEFGIADGTARVALSRMVSAGDLINNDGLYELSGPHLVRQQRQDQAQQPSQQPWDGSWEQVAISAGPRPAAERQSTRRALDALKFAEYREGLWLRPANLDPDRLPAVRAQLGPELCWFRSRPEDPAALAANLWDLDAWADGAARLCADMDRSVNVATGFVLSAAVLRHFLADPELPADLAPPDWPAELLRVRYQAFDAVYRSELSSFFRSHGGWTG